jgi:hypothetical protein
MMIKETIPGVDNYITKMHVAEQAGDMEEYWRLDAEAGELIKEWREKERAEYLEIFGIDIDEYPDYSYRLFYNLEEAKGKLYGKR